MDQKQYHNDEMRRLGVQLSRIEGAPLADRREGRKDWADMLTDAEIIGERVDWILAGNYGYGAMICAQEIISRPRMNRAAALGQLLAALDCGCPANFAAQAWRDLPADQQAKVNAAINATIEHHEKATA